MPNVKKTSAQAAKDKYLEKLDGIKVWVPKGDREKYKALAARCGVSLNALVVSLLDEKMKENPPPAAD